MGAGAGDDANASNPGRGPRAHPERGEHPQQRSSLAARRAGRAQGRVQRRCRRQCARGNGGQGGSAGREELAGQGRPERDAQRAHPRVRVRLTLAHQARRTKARAGAGDGRRSPAGGAGRGRMAGRRQRPIRLLAHVQDGRGRPLPHGHDTSRAQRSRVLGRGRR